MKALLSTTYFGPIQWYQKLNRYSEAVIERCENYPKQTFRNRCVIATANGTQALAIPVSRGNTPLTKDIRISSHGNWRHVHWHALMSAYGESPFFEYYEDDIRPFFEQQWDFLYDFNMEICHKICELIDIRPNIKETDSYIKSGQCGCADFRESINPKHPDDDTDFTPRRYYQVYESRHGFIPNLSILDLLFNMGPEGIFYL